MCFGHKLPVSSEYWQEWQSLQHRCDAGPSHCTTYALDRWAPGALTVGKKSVSSKPTYGARPSECSGCTVTKESLGVLKKGRKGISPNTNMAHASDYKCALTRRTTVMLEGWANGLAFIHYFLPTSWAAELDATGQRAMLLLDHYCQYAGDLW
ncbi:hypothetical protein CB1_000142004 [Camelus ferus]|nr:hypothetical protein CB1_000142004 [Camelus ferus]